MNKRRRYKAKRRQREWRFTMGRWSKRQHWGLMQRRLVLPSGLFFHREVFSLMMEGIA